jgi:hypothetical protein
MAGLSDTSPVFRHRFARCVAKCGSSQMRAAAGSRFALLALGEDGRQEVEKQLLLCL